MNPALTERDKSREGLENAIGEIGLVGLGCRVVRKDQKSDLKYLSGFGNHVETEAIPGALPRGQNSPQKPAFGLYAEQLSGTAFTAPRSENLRTWLYRIRPALAHSAFEPIAEGEIRSRPFTEIPPSPNQMRWNPLPIPKEPTQFVEGLKTMAGNGGNATSKGTAIHIYAINEAMTDRYFYNADGELLFVPEQGGILLRTELGNLNVNAGEIAVIPRGIRFQVAPVESAARGYVCENYGAPFRLPELGPIGANGLAAARDFLTPVAAFEDKAGDFELVAKFQGKLWCAKLDHSPLDVVAWHGNYAPYKYDLALFTTMGTVSVDHPDPSIFTVLTSPSEFPGIANVDFVIFPPRWMVAEHTFRPPYFHRNVMSEFMGLIYGAYDAKAADSFVPGGSSLHNCMSGHGPDAVSFEKAANTELKPVAIKNTMAFMFESSLVFHPTAYAMGSSALQKNYLDCWRDLKSHFKHG